MANAPHPTSQPARLEQLTTLTSSQRTLLQVLVEKNEALGRMFVGAVMARAATDNPDYLSQASNSLRELIDKVPDYFDVPVNPTDKLGNKVNALITYWNREPRVKDKSDEPLTPGFIKRLEKFFEWQATNFVARREVARRTIRKLDASGRPLPSRIEELHAEEWMTIRGFFVESTHHEACTAEEFDDWLSAFESFLLNRVRPRIFDNADKIDELIREGESDV